MFLPLSVLKVRAYGLLATGCIIALVMAGTAHPVDYQPGGTIRAGIYIDPPVTIREEYGGYSGIAVELWEIVAKRMQVQTEYVVFDKFPDLLAACGSGDIDIAVHALGVNSQRAAYLWYSFPWHLSAARIMTLEQKTGSFWAEFQRFRHFRAYSIFIIIFFIMVVAMTLLRRRLEKDFPPDWKTGITLSMLDVAKALRSGALNQSKIGWFGCLLSVLWIIFGVTASAYFTSSIASAMSSSNLHRQEVTGVSSLAGKRVGVMVGDSSQVLLDELGMNTRHYVGIPACIDGLLAGEVDAIVSTAAALDWFDRKHPELPLQVVGEQFFAKPSGFATSRKNVEFMDRVSMELIWLYETGKVE